MYRSATQDEQRHRGLSRRQKSRDVRGRLLREGAVREGAAAVELAVCLPLVVFLFLSSIDTSNMVYLKQAATAAAYEAARVASGSGGTEDMAVARALEVLSAREIADGAVEVEPAINTETARGTPITVTVEVPADANSLGIGSLFTGRQVEAAVIMVRL